MDNGDISIIPSAPFTLTVLPHLMMSHICTCCPCSRKQSAACSITHSLTHLMQWSDRSFSEFRRTSPVADPAHHMISASSNECTSPASTDQLYHAPQWNFVFDIQYISMRTGEHGTLKVCTTKTTNSMFTCV